MEQEYQTPQKKKKMGFIGKTLATLALVGLAAGTYSFKDKIYSTEKIYSGKVKTSYVDLFVNNRFFRRTEILDETRPSGMVRRYSDKGDNKSLDKVVAGSDLFVPGDKYFDKELKPHYKFIIGEAIKNRNHDRSWLARQ